MTWFDSVQPGPLVPKRQWTPLVRIMIGVWIFIGGLGLLWVGRGPAIGQDWDLKEWRDGLAGESVPDFPPVPDMEANDIVKYADLLALRSEVKTTAGYLRTLEESGATWQNRKTDLLRGDLGMRLATSEPHVKVARRLLDIEQPQQAKIAIWSDKHQLAAAAIHQMSPHELTPDFAAMVHSLSKDIRLAHDRFTRTEQLYTVLKTESARLTAGSQTLEASLELRNAGSKQEVTNDYQKRRFADDGLREFLKRHREDQAKRRPSR